jgi:predicted NAD-dependent protein-ADP-ribosyltransferase YbiA (DUF1768 family)
MMAQMQINSIIQKFAKDNNIEAYFISTMMGKAVLKELIKGDIIWAIGSVCFLYFFFIFHMKSFILASIAIA